MRYLSEAFPEFRWRLDLTHTRSLAAVEGFLQSLGEKLCEKNRLHGRCVE